MSQIVYGLHAVQSVLKHQSSSVIVLWYDKKRQDQRLQRLLTMAQDYQISCQPAARSQLDQKADSDRHQGIVIEVKEQQQLPLEDLLDTLSEPALLLILDGVTDPHNLGACLRTADAAGVHAVIYPKDKSAGLNATVRKVACGAAEVIPSYPVTNLARTLEQLKQRGIWIVGTAGEAEQEIYDMDLTGPMALVMGAEGDGMRRLTRESCDYLAKLPMAGTVSSLNVSVATGVCLFEMVRQRR
ncbi:23S rRNA (guanosine-2'-O-)-methyltransferase RlmB [BD1-7 clade bacterium]|uniref:23S rRNA (guanosine-2'-O-)-methyltransferase RlmB n=1 Tax=BD1-7 clade bacterium TaxID=2029982 RepID=A0A5S9QD99_9GAMM|nr:23S rRNA (guanosine-2'-O-)-methyltransferase RlmB [BD1-7 clade bacterium]CAA0100682.1 23S rRNA (guanosine-2'-O-)-methyltransferase RlmB [BD1-7 clade bacterium]CAA0116336.1 23S rRNA (guanosine-2'-O-)-methyltransferase RlmB [BD1-7 clade bacterium]